MVLYERIRMLAKEYGISIINLQKELGFSKHAIFRWRKSENPSAESLAKVADFFHVSMDYLMGRTNHREVAEDSEPSSIAILKLIHKIESSNYSDTQAKIILNLIDCAENFDDEKEKQ